MMDSHTWNTLIASLPNHHLLQTWEWGQIKARVGWQPTPLVWYHAEHQPATKGEQLSFQQGVISGMARDERSIRAAALVLQRTIPIGGFAARLRVMYVPKGPLLADWGDIGLRQRVLSDLRAFARQHGAIFIKIDPDVCLGRGIPGRTESVENAVGNAVREDLLSRGWHFSAEQIQFRNTLLIDLSPPEEELLAAMKPKTRYNVRLALRKGVSVRVGSVQDLEMLYRMYAETAVRDGFVIRDEAYYRAIWQTFLQPASETPASKTVPLMQPLIAEVEGEPVAGLLLFRFASRAWYLYGMSREHHRDKMPNYLLQWEAIRAAKAAGCQVYDLWGAPDAFEESDSMWGVFRFKEGLGGEVVRTLGAWDLPLQPVVYKLYTRFLPRLLDVLRNRGKARTRQNLERKGSPGSLVI
jgi:peptidoglycan pentaglycine glycine transferase (the first glycine)